MQNTSLGEQPHGKIGAEVGSLISVDTQCEHEIFFSPPSIIHFIINNVHRCIRHPNHVAA